MKLGDSADHEIGDAVMAVDGAGLAEDSAHADTLGADDVLADDVADEEGVAGADTDLAQGGFKHARVGLADADSAGIDADGEELEQVVHRQVLVEDEAGDEGVGDEGELQAALAERGQGGDDVGGDAGVVGEGGLPLPGQFLKGGIVEAELHFFADFDQQIKDIEFATAQDRPEVGPADGPDLRFVVAFEGGERMAPGSQEIVGFSTRGFEDFGAVHGLEVKERVAKIEEDRFKHDNSSDTSRWALPT